LSLVYFSFFVSPTPTKKIDEVSEKKSVEGGREKKRRKKRRMREEARRIEKRRGKKRKQRKITEQGKGREYQGQTYHLLTFLMQAQSL